MIFPMSYLSLDSSSILRAHFAARTFEALLAIGSEIDWIEQVDEMRFRRVNNTKDLLGDSSFGE
jgi:hypothetical protein